MYSWQSNRIYTWFIILIFYWYSFFSSFPFIQHSNDFSLFTLYLPTFGKLCKSPCCFFSKNTQTTIALCSMIWVRYMECSDWYLEIHKLDVWIICSPLESRVRLSPSVHVAWKWGVVSMANCGEALMLEQARDGHQTAKARCSWNTHRKTHTSGP